MSEPASNSEAGAPVGGETGQLVLVVEDNERNARLITAILASAGYRTCLAVDGIEGQQQVRERLPALIITDLQMPRLDGVAMTRILKASEETREIPIIAVSAHALSDHRQDALGAGCCSFVTKPFRYQSLLSEVADAIGCQRPTA